MIADPTGTANFIRLDDNDEFVGWVLSLCILIPLLLLAYGAVKIAVNRLKIRRFDQQTASALDVNKQLMRMPKSFRDLTNTSGFGVGEGGHTHDDGDGESKDLEAVQLDTLNSLDKLDMLDTLNMLVTCA